MNVGLGINHLGQGHGLFRVAQRVAGVRVPEFHGRGDVAGAEGVDRLAGLAVEQINLSDALIHLAIAVIQVHAGGNRPGIDAKERQLAEMRLGHRLENIKHRFRIVQADLHFRVVGIDRLDFLAVHGRGAVFGDEIHQARDADVIFRRSAKQRDERFLLHRRVDAGAKFLLRQAAFFEKLVHQLVVGLGDVLDQLAVQFLDPRFQFTGGRLFLEFAAGIGRIGHDLVAQHVERAIEAGAGIHRHTQRKDVPAKPFLHLFHHRVEIHVLLVHRVHHDHLRNAVAGRVIPHPVGADAETVLRVNDHQREIADAQRGPCAR